MITITIYMDNVYHDFWENVEKYGNTNMIDISLSENDFSDWFLKHVEPYTDSNTGIYVDTVERFLDVYTCDEVDDLYEWVLNNGIEHRVQPLNEAISVYDI